MTHERFTPLPAPGGWVCETCGIPVEDEPCAQHNRVTA